MPTLLPQEGTKELRGQPDSLKVMQVIEVKCLRGSGTDGDPVRIVTRYYSMDGDALAEYDPEQHEF
jgi:hypothetical protein